MGRFLSATLAIFLAELRAISCVMTDDLACTAVYTEAVVAEYMFCFFADLAFTSVPNMRL